MALLSDAERDAIARRRAPVDRRRLRACAREEAANLRLPVGAHVWPDNGRPELIRLSPLHY
jgi:hypothetical protein